MTGRARGRARARVVAAQRREARNRIIAIVLVIMVIAGFAATLVFSRDGGGKADSALAGQVRAYVDAINPIAYRGGQIVQESIKPRLADLTAGRVKPAQFESEAQGWRTEFVSLRSQLATVPHGGKLAAVAALYDKAMTGYIAAIDEFVTAARKPSKPERDAALSQAEKAASRTDADYDAARAALVKLAREAGLDPASVR